MRRLLSTWLVLTVSVALTLASIVAGMREAAPFFASGTSIESKFASLSVEMDPPGLSFFSKRMVLDDCNFTLNSISIVMLDDADQTSIRRNCGAVASAIVAEAPSFSYAWYIKALAGDAGEQEAVFEDALLRSRRFAPNQEDLAFYRAVLTYYHWQFLSAPAQAELTSDIVVAAHSSRGRLWVAKRYIDDEAYREVVVDAMEKAPADIQRYFLQSVASLSS